MGIERELINRVEARSAAYVARVRLGLQENHPVELLLQNDRIACVLNDLKLEMEHILMEKGGGK